MSTEDKMTIDERYKYLRRMRKRYLEASRKERGQLLDEMEAVTEMHRKSLIRLMGGSLERKERQRQRGRTYGPEGLCPNHHRRELRLPLCRAPHPQPGLDG